MSANRIVRGTCGTWPMTAFKEHRVKNKPTKNFFMIIKSALSSKGNAVPDGQNHVFYPGVFLHFFVECHNCGGIFVEFFPVLGKHFARPENIIGNDQASGT